MLKNKENINYFLTKKTQTMKHKQKSILQFEGTISKRAGTKYIYFWCSRCEVNIPEKDWFNEVHIKKKCNYYKSNLEIRRKAEGKAIKGTRPGGYK